MLEIIILSSVLGVFAGVSAGLFGIGGGLIIVPVLALLFSAHGFNSDVVMIQSVATSLATIVFTSIASIAAHHRLGTVMWGSVQSLVPGIVLGAAAGAVVADYLDGSILRTLFVIYLVAVSIQMALQAKPKPGSVRPSQLAYHAAAVTIGLLSSILGIGGGTLTVPFLVYFQTPMRNAVAVSSACGLPLAVAGTVSYAVLGWDAPHRPEESLGYIYLPAFFGIIVTSILMAPVGAKLATIIPAMQLKRYFSVLLLIMAAKLVWF